MPENKLSLTLKERLFLSNQYRILEALYPDEADAYAVRREALEQGYELLYDWEVTHISDGEHMLTREEALEVWETFEMFDSLKRSAENLGKLEWLSKQRNSSFLGYDGNNETKFMALCSYTIERLGRFRYIDLPGENYFNSHCPMRPTYRKMLERWKECTGEDRFNLTKAQIGHVLGLDE